MGFLGKLGRLALDLIEVPVAITKDVATLGGTLTDNQTSYTSEKLHDIQNDFDGLKDELDKE